MLYVQNNNHQSNLLRRTTIATQSTYTAPVVPLVSHALALPTHPCFGNDPPNNVIVLDREQKRKYNKINLSLVTEARTRLAYHKRRQPELIPALDNSILIIEDDGGSLWHHEGDLSFLMDSPPVIWKSFAKQLKDDIQKDYEEHQQAVWKYAVKHNEPFITPCGRQAAIFPIHTMRTSFTVTIFFVGLGPILV